jgi:hypothetical protein
MQKLRQVAQSLISSGPMDAVGIGVINFLQAEFSWSLTVLENSAILDKSQDEIFFDLASLTKPLTNSLGHFLRPEAFDPSMLLCLNHRGGLPAWGLLPADTWKEQILGYPIKESETLYSDYSALRVMLELEKKKISQKKICSEVWDQEMIYWLDLPTGCKTLQCGYWLGQPNHGGVHDPNAWNLKTFCSFNHRWALPDPSFLPEKN